MMIENGKVIIESLTANDQKHLTKWYTEHAVSFIERHKDAPFFLYVPQFCRPELEGKHINPLEPLALYDLSTDPGETKNVVAEHPEIAARMKAWGEAHADEFYPGRRRK